MYTPIIASSMVVVGLAMLAHSLGLTTPDAGAAWELVRENWHVVWGHVYEHKLMYGLLLVGIYFLLPAYRWPTYLVDFDVAIPPEDWRMSREELIEILRRLKRADGSKAFSDEAIAFQARLLSKSAIGDSTSWPPWILKVLRDEDLAPEDYERGMQAAREEARTLMFSAFRNMQARTGLKGKDVDFLIVNCSLFSPTPSLAAMVASEFGMRSDVRTYNLSGQGCSASILAVDLAQQLLQAKPGSTAVVISTENLTLALYTGEDRSMLLQNTLFRCGAAAIQLSSKPADGFRAKYKLLRAVRTQNTAPEAYEAVFEKEDEDGNRGVSLSKALVKNVGKALKANLTSMGPSVLPLREQIKTVSIAALRHLAKASQGTLASLGWADAAAAIPTPAPYVPSFLTGVRHFCIHAGGRRVIEGIEDSLKLPKEATAPSRAALHTFGNTSSSSIWYELKFIEQEQDRWVAPDAGPPIQAGERVLQLAFGSGLKVNSALWLRLQ